jgi:hypothetical protein
VTNNATVNPMPASAPSPPQVPGGPVVGQCAQPQPQGHQTGPDDSGLLADQQPDGHPPGHPAAPGGRQPGPVQHHASVGQGEQRAHQIGRHQMQPALQQLQQPPADQRQDAGAQQQGPG